MAGRAPVLMVEDIARVAHEANRALCSVFGDDSHSAWDEAPPWQRESAVDGVRAILEGRVLTPQDSHENWVREKRRAGWKYGEVKDVEARTHPCAVPFEELPLEQQLKDWLFFGVVIGLRHGVVLAKPEEENREDG